MLDFGEPREFKLEYLKILKSNTYLKVIHKVPPSHLIAFELIKYIN